MRHVKKIVAQNTISAFKSKFGNVRLLVDSNFNIIQYEKSVSFNHQLY